MAIIAVVTVLMIAVYFNAHTKTQSLQRTSAELTLNHLQLDARIGAITSSAVLSTDESTNDRIGMLQARIADRNALLEQIDSLVFEPDVGFAAVFEILAQANLPGLWLTGVQLDHDGSIQISGTTIDAKLVPRYLRMITLQSPLSSLNSGTVNLIREQSNLAEINFVLSYNAYGEEP